MLDVVVRTWLLADRRLMSVLAYPHRHEAVAMVVVVPSTEPRRCREELTVAQHHMGGGYGPRKREVDLEEGFLFLSRRVRANGFLVPVTF